MRYAHDIFPDSPPFINKARIREFSYKSQNILQFIWKIEYNCPSKRSN